MTELDLVTRLREELPAPSLDHARARLRAEIGGRPGRAPRGRARQGGPRRGRARLGLAAGTAVAAAAAGIFALTGLPHSAQRGSQALQHHLAAPRRATTAAQLVAYATRAAAAAPAFAPRPHQWTYEKQLQAISSAGQGGDLFGPVAGERTVQTWTRVDGRQTATLAHGKLVISPVTPGTPVPLPAGWSSVSYGQLDALIGRPARIKAELAAGLGTHASPAIFTAVQALMANVVLPPRLEATLYGVLASLPGVHFDQSVRDLAGRPGIGLDVVEDGYVKDEIVISRTSYAFMGQEYVAVRAHVSTGLDRTAHIRKGQVLGWLALVQSGIVNHPGQRPGR